MARTEDPGNRYVIGHSESHMSSIVPQPRVPDGAMSTFDRGLLPVVLHYSIHYRLIIGDRTRTRSILLASSADGFPTGIPGCKLRYYA
jgi:hypothetical protein